MSSTPSFHALTVAQVRPEAAGSVAVTFHIPSALQGLFEFQPGQFLTLRTHLDGQEVRRNYSICSTPKRLQEKQEIEIGVRAVPGGLFSNWAVDHLKAGDTLDVMPPEGRFVSKKPRALHRVGFAAGSGITPILSLMQHSLETQPDAKFSLVYGNRNMASVMFNETLQDLKDRYADRVTLLHILSRQEQSADLLEGRIDAEKVRTLIDTLLPVGSLAEVFVCGPEGMIDATEQALLAAGVATDRVHSERFGTRSPSPDSAHDAKAAARSQGAQNSAPTGASPASANVALTLVLDGQTHTLNMTADERVLEVALAAGLDVPYSCKGGVCCTCRAKVLQGSVQMDRNFTLEKWETDQGFVLSCQARPSSDKLTLSYDER